MLSVGRSVTRSLCTFIARRRQPPPTPLPPSLSATSIGIVAEAELWETEEWGHCLPSKLADKFTVLTHGKSDREVFCFCRFVL